MDNKTSYLHLSATGFCVHTSSLRNVHKIIYMRISGTHIIIIIKLHFAKMIGQAAPSQYPITHLNLEPEVELNVSLFKASMRAEVRFSDTSISESVKRNKKAPLG